MRIAIGSDHRGFQVKSKIIELLKRLNHEVIDVGTHGTESVDYPDFAHLVAAKVGRKAHRPDGGNLAQHSLRGRPPCSSRRKDQPA